jgi:hypothetical protein
MSLSWVQKFNREESAHGEHTTGEWRIAPCDHAALSNCVGDADFDLVDGVER